MENEEHSKSVANGNGTQPAVGSAERVRHAVAPVSNEGDVFAKDEIVDRSYKVVRMIGRGGMGEVYRARDVELGTDVALKVVSQAFSRDNKHALDMLRNEAKKAASLRHKNIVSVIGLKYDERKGVWYVIMEYIDGGSLHAVLDRETRLSEEQAVVIVQEIANALHVASGLKIAHRDIKPDNIMFTSRGEVKLADLGIARHYGSLSSSSDNSSSHDYIVGTPAYLAPEQIRDPEVYDIRSDIYSLGVTFYEMVTGRRPFEGEYQDLRAQILYAPPTDPREFNPQISEWCSALILRMLEKSPDKRFNSPKELIEAMDAGPYVFNILQREELIKKAVAGNHDTIVDSKTSWSTSKYLRKPVSMTAYKISLAVMMLAVIVLLCFGALLFLYKFNGDVDEQIANDQPLPRVSAKHISSPEDNGGADGSLDTAAAPAQSGQDSSEGIVDSAVPTPSDAPGGNGGDAAETAGDAVQEGQAAQATADLEAERLEAERKRQEEELREAERRRKAEEERVRQEAERKRKEAEERAKQEVEPKRLEELARREAERQAAVFKGYCSSAEEFLAKARESTLALMKANDVKVLQECSNAANDALGALAKNRGVIDFELNADMKKTVEELQKKGDDISTELVHAKIIMGAFLEASTESAKLFAVRNADKVKEGCESIGKRRKSAEEAVGKVTFVAEEAKRQIGRIAGIEKELGEYEGRLREVAGKGERSLKEREAQCNAVREKVEKDGCHWLEEDLTAKSLKRLEDGLKGIDKAVAECDYDAWQRNMQDFDGLCGVLGALASRDFALAGNISTLLANDLRTQNFCKALSELADRMEPSYPKRYAEQCNAIRSGVSKFRNSLDKFYKANLAKNNAVKNRYNSICANLDSLENRMKNEGRI